MSKKDYVLTFLDKVKDFWEPARWFSVLIRYNILNDEQIDTIFSVFKDVVKSSSNEQKKWKIQRAINAAEEIRNKEENLSILNQNLDKILNE